MSNANANANPSPWQCQPMPMHTHMAGGQKSASTLPKFKPPMHKSKLVNKDTFGQIFSFFNLYYIVCLVYYAQSYWPHRDQTEDRSRRGPLPAEYSIIWTSYLNILILSKDKPNSLNWNTSNDSDSVLNMILESTAYFVTNTPFNCNRTFQLLCHTIS